MALIGEHGWANAAAESQPPKPVILRRTRFLGLRPAAPDMGRYAGVTALGGVFESGSKGTRTPDLIHAFELRNPPKSPESLLFSRRLRKD